MPTHASHLVQRFLVKHQITQVTRPHYSPDLAPCDFWLFQKLKCPLKGKRFQTINEIQENTTGQLMETGRTVWGPKVPTLKGTEASLSYVQCFLYLVSSSINVSIFHITWLDTFWIHYIYIQGEAKGNLQLWVCETVYCIINYCIIFHTNNFELTFASPVYTCIFICYVNISTYMGLHIHRYILNHLKISCRYHNSSVINY